VCGVYVYVCVCVMMSMSSIVPLMTLPTADQEHDMKRIGLDEVTIYGPSFAVSFFTYVSVLLCDCPKQLSNLGHILFWSSYFCDSVASTNFVSSEGFLFIISGKTRVKENMYKWVSV
jgi:hypothetical protein